MKSPIKLSLLALVLAVSACVTPSQITYIKDMEYGKDYPAKPAPELHVQKQDRLSIHVYSSDPALATPFNVGALTNEGAGATSSASYVVDSGGYIDFPVLGTLHIAGLTRHELQQMVKERILGESLCLDPTVIVNYSGLSFYVIGESGKGERQIYKDRINILEAVSMAGDLSINGLRKNVLVLRQEGDHQVSYRIDLTDSKSVYNSPAYYIRQNDIVYVEPNDKTKRGATVMGSQAYTPSFWFGMFSSVMSVALLILNLTK